MSNWMRAFMPIVIAISMALAVSSCHREEDYFGRTFPRACTRDSQCDSAETCRAVIPPYQAAADGGMEPIAVCTSDCLSSSQQGIISTDHRNGNNRVCVAMGADGRLDPLAQAFSPGVLVHTCVNSYTSYSCHAFGLPQWPNVGVLLPIQR